MFIDSIYYIDKIIITTYIATTFLKIIEFSDAPSTGFGPSRSQCKIHQQMIGWSGNLRGISKSEEVSFQMVMERNYPIC